MIFDCVEYFVTVDFVTIDLNRVLCNCVIDLLIRKFLISLV